MITVSDNTEKDEARLQRELEAALVMKLVAHEGLKIPWRKPWRFESAQEYMKDKLLDELADLIESLHEKFKKEGMGRSVSVFLHQSIAKNADEETLKKILTDLTYHT